MTTVRPVHACRVYEDPHDSKLWEWHENTIREANSNEVLGALQLYSDKTQVTMKGHSCYPVRASLLNVGQYMRNTNLRELGFFPVIDRPSGLSDTVWRHAKLTLISKCLGHLLAPLKAASVPGHGVLVYDPEGVRRCVVPRLLSYMCDDPEGKDVSCIKGGNTECPCEMCMVGAASTPCAAVQRAVLCSVL